jgi:hypothetical protein
MSDVTDARARGPVDPNEAAMAALGSAEEHAAHTRETVGRLHELVERQDRPGRLQVLELTQVTPVRTDDVAEISRSFAVLNLGGPLNVPGVDVLVGSQGMRARVDAQPFVVPARRALVLPIEADIIEVGVDPATIGAGDRIVVFLIRFSSLQPFYFGG